MDVACHNVDGDHQRRIPKIEWPSMRPACQRPKVEWLITIDAAGNPFHTGIKLVMIHHTGLKLVMIHHTGLKLVMTHHIGIKLVMTPYHISIKLIMIYHIGIKLVMTYYTGTKLVTISLRRHKAGNPSQR